MISVTLFNLGLVVTSEQMTIKLKLVPLSKVLETNLLLWVLLFSFIALISDTINCELSGFNNFERHHLCTFSDNLYTLNCLYILELLMWSLWWWVACLVHEAVLKRLRPAITISNNHKLQTNKKYFKMGSQNTSLERHC